ncbi:hypothetical protein ACJMK2_039334 [Sinanodonta woodiana]|uniref:RING-type domain-containing protein n=1 Tax=Sinanodonta woodiana TaxID=1069815 RepID=A0ABD3WF44_SINWO
MAEGRRENEREDCLRELVKCPICLNLCKDPKFLTCQHILCAGCLNGILNNIRSTNRYQTSFSCPVCRKDNDIRADANAYPSLRLAANLIEELNRFPETSDNADDILTICHEMTDQVKIHESLIVCDTETIQACLAVEDLTEDERYELIQLHEENGSSSDSCRSLLSAISSLRQEVQGPSNNENDTLEPSNRSVVTHHHKQKIQEYRNKIKDLVKRQKESRHRMEMIVSNSEMPFNDNVDNTREPVQLSSSATSTNNRSRSPQVVSQPNRAREAAEHEHTVQSLEAHFVNLSIGARPFHPSLIQMQTTSSLFEANQRNQQPDFPPVGGQSSQSQRVEQVQDSANVVNIYPELMNRIGDQISSNNRNRGPLSTNEESRSHEPIHNRESAISLVEKQPTYSGCFTVKISSDKECCDIVGIAVLQDATIVVADKGNTNLKVFDGHHILISTLTFKTFAGDITKIGENQLAMTLPVCFQIVKLSLASGRLEINATINLNSQCWGITSNGQTLYVTCGSSTDAHVQILGCNGSVCRKIHLKDHCMDVPYYIAVSRDGNHIYISDPGKENSKVICISLDREVKLKFTYKDPALKSASGVTLDGHNNALVCAANSNNIHLVSNDGSKVRYFIDGGSLCGRPRAICFNDDCSKVYVSFTNSEEIRYFNIS